LRVIIFLAIVSAILFGMHYYLWLRLVRDTGIAEPWRSIASVGLLLLGATMLAGIPLMRFAPRQLTSPVMWVAYTWMGLAFFTIVLLGMGELIKLGARLASRASGFDVERRQLARWIAAVATGGAAGLSAWGARGARVGAAETKRVRIGLARLPQSLTGYRIAQITDIHVGPTIGRAYVEDIVDRVNALEPNLVAVTGDLVDGSVEQLGSLVEPIANLKAADGVFFVTGNHEYFVPGLERWLQFLKEHGLRVLRNERVPIRGSAGFDLAGIDDLTAKSYGRGHGADLPRALAGRDLDRAIVLLAHQPRQVKDAIALDVDLQLSGHTHGGQVFPFSLVVGLFEPYLAGLYKLGQTQLYVSRGTGYWGPPMRLGAPAEITLIELVSA
jgi:predicted MPP superfamily phosphohydrolase